MAVTDKMVEAALAVWCEPALNRDAYRDDVRKMLDAALTVQQEPIMYLITSEIPAKGGFSASSGWVVVKQEDDAKSRCKTMREAGAVATIIPLYSAPPAPAVTVNALEWKEQEEDEFSTCSWSAETIGGGYCVEHRGIDCFDLWFPGNPQGSRFITEVAAKAAAQADYDRRILSALNTKAPSEETTNGND